MTGQNSINDEECNDDTATCHPDMCFTHIHLLLPRNLLLHRRCILMSHVLFHLLHLYGILIHKGSLEHFLLYHIHLIIISSSPCGRGTVRVGGNQHVVWDVIPEAVGVMPRDVAWDLLLLLK